MKKSHRILLTLLFTLILFVCGVHFTTPNTDFQVTHTRDYPIHQEVGWVKRYLSSIQYYQQWHFAAIDTQRVDGQNRPLALKDQIAQPGALILLTLKPKGLKHRQYQAWIQITQFNKEAGMLGVSVLKTSNKKIESLFESLTWNIQIQGDKLHVTIQAKTKSYKSRFLARWTPTILLNQAVFADFSKLAGPMQLESPIPFLEGRN